MLKSRLLGLLVVMISVLVMTFTLTAQPILAQQESEDASELICKDLQEAMKNDLELAELVTNYVELLQAQPLSVDELAKLLMEDENEKVRLLGIKVIHGNYRQEEAATLSLCYAPIWRPGKVVWNFSNPGQYGAKYSVKPEYSTPLIWANPPEQEIDGIYRAAWGSCKAYKVPDGATATFNNAESWTMCYNLTACHFFGKCPGWVNPCDPNSPEHSWPNHPLQ